MMRLFSALLMLAALLFLLFSSGDLRSVIGWLLTGYLVLRAFPAVRNDFAVLVGLFRGRSIRFRRSKVDTL